MNPKYVYRITSQSEEQVLVFHAMTELDYERFEKIVGDMIPKNHEQLSIEYICEYKEWRRKNVNFCPRCGAPFLVSVAFNREKKTWIDCMECQSSFDLTLVK